MKNSKVMFVKSLIAVLCLVCLVGISLLLYLLLPMGQFFVALFVLVFAIAFPSIILSKYILPLYIKYAENEWEKRKKR